MTLDIQAARETLRSGEEAVRRDVVERLGAARQPEAVGLLLEALGDESWPVREAALAHLVEFPDSAVHPALEAALRDHADAGLRNAAMEVYVRRGDLGPLSRLVEDADEEVRNFAAVMIGSLGDAAGTGALIGALADPDVNVRHAAAASLGQIGSPEAVPALIQVLEGEPWLQYPAINALSEIGDPRAVPPLLGLLGEEMLTAPVLEALGRLAGREALPSIVGFLHHEDPVLRNGAIRAVVQIEQRATFDGQSLDPAVQAALKREDLIDHLLETLRDEDPDDRRTAVITLGWLKESRALRSLIDLLGEPGLQEYATHALVSIGFHDRTAWEHGLASHDDQVRQGTVRCIEWIDPPGGIDLVAPLIHDPSPEVRAEAASAIGRLGDADAAMLLFELLADESELIQESAMGALSRMPRERVTPLLLRALESDDEQVRIRAAETLGLLRDPATAAALVRLADDAREDVRRAAVKALGELEAEGVADLLRRSLGDPSSRVRQQAALSLGKQQDPEATDDLIPLLADPDPRMRFVALRALGLIRSPAPVPHLIPFLSDERKELRFAAVESLGAIRAPEAAQPLVAVLSDPDRNLRRAAAESLGSIADPRAVPPLLVALEDDHWSVRCAAATALGRIGNSKAVPALLRRLSDEDITVRRVVASALGDIGDPRAVRRLAELLEDPGIQSTAIEALRRMGAAALSELEHCFSVAEPGSRRALVGLAGKLEDGRARRLLQQALLDDDAGVRAEAALALGDGGFVDSVRALMDLRGSDPAPAVRRAAARALAKLVPR